MNRPARREVGRALAFTIAGRLADARDSLRRLRAFDDRQRWLTRRDDGATQLPLPIKVEGREGGGGPHTPKVLSSRAGTAGAARRDTRLGLKSQGFPR